ncbi:MAG: hypothetical protein ACMZ7B_13510 [Balneola sp.]
MNPINFQGKTYKNWKDYFLDKFSDKELFKVELFDLDDKFLENYRVTTNKEDSETEIIYQIHIDGIKYVELFDVHFNNPKSPKLTAENKSNNYGFDGQGSTFNEKNLIELDDWIEIPISKGWTEKTTYYDGQEVKTECIWTQDNKSEVIPIDQKYLDNYGCLLFPIVPFKIILTNRKLKRNIEKVTTVENVIEPMIKYKSTYRQHRL